LENHSASDDTSYGLEKTTAACRVALYTDTFPFPQRLPTPQPFSHIYEGWSISFEPNIFKLKIERLVYFHF